MMNQVKPMNLVYIMSDSHTKEVLGYYGNDFVKTPNLDKLCGNGTFFKNAYCNNPICVPSRASMTTGDYCFKNSYWDNCHAYDGTGGGWGKRLTEEGYPVTTIGKLHYKNDDPCSGFPDQRLPLHLKNGVGNLTLCIRGREVLRRNHHDHILNARAGLSDYNEYDMNVASKTVEFLKNEAGKQSDKPFCLYVGLVAPHAPLVVPERLLDLYKPFDKLPFPREWKKDERPSHSAIEDYRYVTGTTEDDITDEAIMKAIATYYALVTFLDEQIGLIMNALDDAGLSDSTRVIYTTDHGDTIGDHGTFFKNTMYDPSVSVPLVVVGPDLPKGKVVNQCVSLLDIYPTILENVGIVPNEKDLMLPGRSLFDFALDKTKEERPIFAELHTFAYKHAIYMLRKGKYKLVYYMECEPQLFNMEADPYELNDLGKNLGYQQVIEELMVELRKICDIEDMDQKAIKEQEEMLEQYGGRENIKNGNFFFAYSPVPKDLLEK